MVNRRPAGTALLQGHGASARSSQLDPHPFAHRPADHPADEQVDNHRQIEPPLPVSRYRSYRSTQPGWAGPRPNHRASRLGDGRAVAGIRGPRDNRGAGAARTPPRRISRATLALAAAPPRPSSPICTRGDCHSLAAVAVDPAIRTSDARPDRRAARHGSAAPGIDSRPGDLQHPGTSTPPGTQPFRRDESESHTLSLAKKAVAFFRISRSIRSR